MPRARFHAPAAIAGAPCVLPPEEAHHMRHVLRLGVGAEVSIFDGRGSEWAARVLSIDKRTGVTCELLGELASAPEPPVRVTLAIGALKGDQMDTVVRDATMLGIHAIVPVVSEHLARSRRGARSEDARARWQRISVASAKQCGRAFVPAVAPAVPFSDLFDAVPYDVVVMCVEPALALERVTDLRDLHVNRVLACVGPEGGWSAGEIAAARDKGARFVQLGPRTLRAETVPTVLLAAMWTVWGWN